MSTRPEEFEKFHAAIMSNAPEGFELWGFPVLANDKKPDTRAIKARAPTGLTGDAVYSWKAWHARLNYDEAMRRLDEGGNIGISARTYDPLVLVDVDKARFFSQIKPTLLVATRKVAGAHAYYWAKDPRVKVNIGTDNGELRSADQYILSPGSFVELTDEKIAKMVSDGDINEECSGRIAKSPMRGVYHVVDARPPSEITFEELPEFLRSPDAFVKAPKAKTQFENRNESEFNIADFVDLDKLKRCGNQYRGAHPVHDSPSTGTNFAVNPTKNSWCCFHHNYSGGSALEWLAVREGIIDCADARPGCLRGEVFKRVLELAYAQTGRRDKVASGTMEGSSW